ncbi:bifunctional indole-3-glycerol-phosphate synthase TrpC/phosphoribosylanthranilate isomerase TrpF [Thalassotalea aquiviva]|uniref:bifunctional indole-3-glycerol-phosphate synthase TrpC/phosphoribosylanthranilate isomerase TrpF n=1 Tax=Thalassotalea aquiviva TaxID=3242415 RepID=UPI00352B5DAC
MVNILQKIVSDKLTEIERLKQEMPLASFIDQMKPTTKDMYQALSKPQASFILECKKASPSKGLIRQHFDPVAISKIYQGYASAISVLTDEKYFQGHHQYLKQVADSVDCPVLNKDFFIDEYQIHLGRYYGADAILLMLSVLDDEQYKALAKVAEYYNMAILTEVSNKPETERAIALNARLIGINNRNLRDLTTDISRTFELAPMIPEDRLVLSESGLYTNKQVREIAPAVDGFLVGSSIMAEQDIDFACRKLIYGQHKVCGLTRAKDVIQVIEQGGVYAGLIFAQQSPRQLNIEQAIELQKHVADNTQQAIRYVGVFVNQPIELIVDAVTKLNLYAVQLHGNEDGLYIEQLKIALANTPELKIIKAVSVNNAITLPDADANADFYLLDNKQGGSGKTFDWQLLNQTNSDLSTCFLAGGLSPDNLANAIRAMNDFDLFGLDLNSGLESAPGQKDDDKISQAFGLLRQY